MVQLFVHFVTSFFGEGTKIDVRCFTCPRFRRNVLPLPGTSVVIRLPSISAVSILYFKFGKFLSHAENTELRKNQEK